MASVAFLVQNLVNLDKLAFQELCKAVATCGRSIDVWVATEALFRQVFVEVMGLPFVSACPPATSLPAIGLKSGMGCLYPYSCLGTGIGVSGEREGCIHVSYIGI